MGPLLPRLDWQEFRDGYETARAVLDGTEVLLRADFYRIHIDIWRGREQLVATTLNLGKSMPLVEDRRAEARREATRQLDLLFEQGRLEAPVDERQLEELAYATKILELLGEGFLTVHNGTKAWYAAKMLHEAMRSISPFHTVDLPDFGDPSAGPSTIVPITLVNRAGRRSDTREVDILRHPRAALAGAAAELTFDLED